MATIAEALRIAFDLHQSGRFDEAEVLYGRILDADPDQPRALHFCGLLIAQLGRLEDAARLLRRAIAVAPAAAEPPANLGKILRALGRADEAAPAFAQALALRPDFAEAWDGLGHANRERGDANAAALAFGRAVGCGGGAGSAYHRAMALDAAGRPVEALAALEQAAALDPLSGPVATRLGAQFQAQGDDRKAAGWYRRALALRPNHADTLHNLAALDQGRGELEGAVRGFARALALLPGQEDARGQLAAALLALGRTRLDAGDTRGAADALREAARLAPGEAAVLEPLGVALLGLGRHEEAVAVQRGLVAFHPAGLTGHYNLALAAKGSGRIAESVAALRRASRLSDEPWVHSALLVTSLLLADLDNASLDAEVQGWKARFGRTRPHAPRIVGDAARRPLKVGYVSGYLHPGNRLMAQIAPLLRAHDPDRVEAHVYGDAPYGAPAQDPVRRLARSWCDTRGLDDEAVAARIRADGIDVLVCLLGHTRGERMTLFTHRPAPVQVSYHGMLATGVEAMDAWITDPVLHPADSTERFDEELVRLPHFFLFEPPAGPPVAPPPVLERGSVTFGSFNLDAKLNHRVMDLWSRLLETVPGSRLLLKSRGGGLSGPDGGRRIADAFAARGIGADRLVLMPPAASHEEHLRRHAAIDVALDPFPYGGCLTSFDALSMGVPVVTLAGDRFIGRMTASLLHAAGLGGWVAADESDYVAKAAALAADRTVLSSLRMCLRNKMSRAPLCDAMSYTRSLEAEFLRLRGLRTKV